MEQLKIDPEFKGKIPPLTSDEYYQLEENILADGKVKVPLTVWKGTGIIVDGHNRWKIIQEHPGIPYTIEERDFADKWEAFNWMYKNQLGRRNLTEQQTTYIRGQLYKARKNMHGGNHGNQYTKVANHQNEELASTAKILAKELGIGSTSVERSEKYANGIDAIREVNPGTADAILTGNMKARYKDVQAIGKASPEERQHMIRQIERGEKLTPVDVPDKILINVKSENYKGSGTKAERERLVEIAKAASENYTDAPKITIEDITQEIILDGRQFIRIVKNTLEIHRELIAQNRDKFLSAIDQIMNEIEKAKGDI